MNRCRERARRWSAGALFMSAPPAALAGFAESSSWAVYALFAVIAMIVILLLLHEALHEDTSSENPGRKTQENVQPGKRYPSSGGRTSSSALRRHG